MTIWFASGNIHKKKELAAILSSNGIRCELKSPAEAGLNFDPKETGNSFLENALIKAGELYRLFEKQQPDGYSSGDPIIADDSGICVDALEGRPGIHSARYCGQGKLSDTRLSDTGRNTLLLTELGNNTQRSARFICAMVLYRDPNCFFAAQDTMEGVLVENAESARGSGGHGYDPILIIPSLGRTVAELSDEEKNQHSHRGKAEKQ